MTVQELGPLQLAWVEALESGNYKQGPRRLKNGNEYCCLGVLCELAGLKIDRKDYFSGASGQYYGSYLPPELSAEYGFYGSYGALKAHEGPYTSLADMNDSGNYDFAQIAKYIRENPANVFSKAA